MLRVKDYIVVGSTGVCRVEDIIKESFGGSEVREYYVLEPISGNSSTIYVPTDNDQVCMRKIMTKQDVEDLIKELSDDDFAWNEDDQKRKSEYAEIARLCKPLELVKVLVSLQKRQDELEESGRKLSSIDTEAYKFTEQILKDELALALSLDPEQAISYLLQQLKIKPA